MAPDPSVKQEVPSVHSDDKIDRQKLECGVLLVHTCFYPRSVLGSGSTLLHGGNVTNGGGFVEGYRIKNAA
jgi:hypothetical protein